MYQNGVNVSASSWTAWKLESGRKWKLWNALNALNSERSEVIVIIWTCEGIHISKTTKVIVICTNANTCDVKK
jgi:hypothetical protein